MLSLLPSIVILGLAALAALLISRRRPPLVGLSAELLSASRMLALATAVQSVHFAEEWATDFHVRFPELFGLPPMPMAVFVTFNVTWIVVWTASFLALPSGTTWAVFASWFLAIAGILNGIAHPLIAIASGGYFPGLISSPFIGLASLSLWQRLQRATLPPKD